MNINKNNLIWIDLEMTGLNIYKDHIIEIATLITDINLKILDKGPCLVIKQKKSVLHEMNNWNKQIHTESGLIKLIKKSNCTLSNAEKQTINFLKKWVPKKISPMCGNSISNDRLFLNKYMPELLSYFHYRSIDVSTIKELVRLWNPKISNNIKKNNTHRALDDIYESINELMFYRENFIRIKSFI